MLLRERNCFVDAIIRNAGTVQPMPIDPEKTTDQSHTLRRPVPRKEKKKLKLMKDINSYGQCLLPIDLKKKKMELTKDTDSYNQSKFTMHLLQKLVSDIRLSISITSTSIIYIYRVIR